MAELPFFSYADKPLGLTIFYSIVIFQIFFILFQWFYIRRNDYLYYTAYMVTILIYAWTQFAPYLPVKLPNGVMDQMPYYTRHLIPFIAIFLYYRFSRSFLELPVTRPRLNKLVILLEYFILVTAFLFPLSIAAGLSPEQEDRFFIIICSIVILSSVLIITRFLRKSVPLTRFAMAGAGFIVLGSVIQIILMKLTENGYKLEFDPYLPLLICVIAELFTFTTGLSYKTHLLEKEKLLVERALYNELLTKQKLEKEMFSIRDNIARDLHDEIGSGLSKITLLAEVLKRENSREEPRIAKIIHSAREMMEGMGEMVWALNTKNDDLKNFILYLRRYSLEYFEDSNVNVDFQISHDPCSVKIPGVIRKNILMVYREVLNNILKHSGATQVTIECTLQQNNFRMIISDNGIGIHDIDNRRNGLGNMQTRIHECGGVFSVESHHGVVVDFSVPVPDLKYEDTVV